MRIRLYRPDDIDGVVDLWYAQWQADHPGQVHPYPRERWEYVWHARIVPAAFVWTAVADSGEVAGYIAVRTAEPVVDHVIVRPTYRRRGIGLALLERATWVHKRGFRCHTAPDNAAMAGLLAKAGLREGASDVEGLRMFEWVAEMG